MAVALLSFTTLAIAGRFAGKGTDPMHMMFYRSIIALVIVTICAAVSSGGLAQLASNRLALHGVRNVIHFIAQFSWLSALLLGSLAQLVSIEFTAPLWVAILAPFILGERLSAIRAMAAVLGFAGVLIIMQPSGVEFGAGAVFALIAAIGFAGSMITTKLLVRTETILCFLFHMAWMQLLISAGFVAHDLQLPARETLFAITAIAIFGLSAHFALARAFTHADAIIVAPLDFLRVP